MVFKKEVASLEVYCNEKKKIKIISGKNWISNRKFSEKFKILWFFSVKFEFHPQGKINGKLS